MKPLALVALACLLLSTTAALAQPLPVTERGLLPGDVTMGPAVNTQQEHSIAKGGDQYLVAWTDLRGQAAGGGAGQSGADIFGIRLDAQGHPIEAMPFLIAGGMGLQQRPLVAWNGQAWLVVYISQDRVGGYYEDRMRAVRVSAQGQILDATPIAFPPTQFIPDTIGLQVAGQSGQWLITRCIYHDDSYGTKLVGQRLDGSGTLLDTTPRLLLDWVYGGTRLLAANGEYLVAGPDWNDSATTKACRIGLDAQPIGASFTVPSLNLATDGSEYYVSWIADYVNLVGSRMTSTGTLLTPTGTTIVAGFSQYNQSTLAHDGTRWWLEWGASDQLHTVRIDAAGTVLDPDGGVLLPIVIGGNINTAYGPALVPRVGGGVELFWYDLRVALDYDTNVFALPVSPANVPGAERCVSTGTRNQRTPDFAEGPDGQIAVTFLSETANDDRVLVHLLDPNGLSLTAEPIEVTAAPSIGKSGIAWNGSVYLVTWDEGALGIRARRMNADGTLVDGTPLTVMPGFSPDVEALGEDFLIACARFAGNPQEIDAWMRIVDGPTGAFQNAATLIGGGYVNVGPRVHNDGVRWMVTYHSHWSHDSSASDAVYNFVSPNGSFTPAANPATTSGASGTPDMAFSGQKYLFVWRNNSLANANNYIAGRIMNANGTFATGNFTIAEAPGRQLSPVAGWDGTDFVVAWDDQRNQGAFFDERTDIYAARVSEAGTVLDPAGFPVYAGPQGDATAAILSRPDGVSFVASARFQTAAPFDTYRIGITALGLEAAVAGVGTPGMPIVALGQNLPNPFNAHTNIDYSLESAQSIRLSVYDMNGRTVRTLMRDVIVPAGRHAVAWDGRADDGRVVPSGVYFSRLEAGGRTALGRMALIR
jgi:hypothetical protein